MKWVATVLFLTLFASGCGSRPPPQACELPPPEKKEVVIGSCPVDTPPTDAGADVRAD
ncbi:MAG: hypothetical protein ACXVEF_15195 [Polyangiales bacterium]